MQQVMPVNVPPQPPNPPADANFVLKFTYGVNAYKHWVLQKNAQIEKAATASGSPMGARFGGARSGFRLLKLDPLHCTADELNCALCMFVREVRKPNGDQYAPDSILYLCLGSSLDYLNIMITQCIGYRQPVAMIGWHVARHWPVGDQALPPPPIGQHCQNGVNV